MRMNTLAEAVQQQQQQQPQRQDGTLGQQEEQGRQGLWTEDGGGDANEGGVQEEGVLQLQLKLPLKLRKRGEQEEQQQQQENDRQQGRQGVGASDGSETEYGMIRVKGQGKAAGVAIGGEGIIGVRRVQLLHQCSAAAAAPGAASPGEEGAPSTSGADGGSGNACGACHKGRVVFAVTAHSAESAKGFTNAASSRALGDGSSALEKQQQQQVLLEPCPAAKAGCSWVDGEDKSDGDSGDRGGRGEGAAAEENSYGSGSIARRELVLAGPSFKAGPFLTPGVGAGGLAGSRSFAGRSMQCRSSNSMGGGVAAAALLVALEEGIPADEAAAAVALARPAGLGGGVGTLGGVGGKSGRLKGSRGRGTVMQTKTVVNLTQVEKQQRVAAVKRKLGIGIRPAGEEGWGGAEEEEEGGVGDEGDEEECEGLEDVSQSHGVGNGDGGALNANEAMTSCGRTSIMGVGRVSSCGDQLQRSCSVAAAAIAGCSVAAAVAGGSVGTGSCAPCLGGTLPGKLDVYQVGKLHVTVTREQREATHTFSASLAGGGQQLEDAELHAEAAVAAAGGAVGRLGVPAVFAARRSSCRVGALGMVGTGTATQPPAAAEAGDPGGTSTLAKRSSLVGAYTAAAAARGSIAGHGDGERAAGAEGAPSRHRSSLVSVAGSDMDLKGLQPLMRRAAPVISNPNAFLDGVPPPPELLQLLSRDKQHKGTGKGKKKKGKKGKALLAAVGEGGGGELRGKSGHGGCEGDSGRVRGQGEAVGGGGRVGIVGYSSYLQQRQIAAQLQQCGEELPQLQSGSQLASLHNSSRSKDSHCSDQRVGGLQAGIIVPGSPMCTSVTSYAATDPLCRGVEGEQPQVGAPEQGQQPGRALGMESVRDSSALARRSAGNGRDVRRSSEIVSDGLIQDVELGSASAMYAAQAARTAAAAAAITPRIPTAAATAAAGGTSRTGSSNSRVAHRSDTAGVRDYNRCSASTGSSRGSNGSSNSNSRRMTSPNPKAAVFGPILPPIAKPAGQGVDIRGCLQGLKSKPQIGQHVDDGPGLTADAEIGSGFNPRDLLAGLGPAGSTLGLGKSPLDLKEIVKNHPALLNKEQLGRWALGWGAADQQGQQKVRIKAAAAKQGCGRDAGALLANKSQLQHGKKGVKKGKGDALPAGYLSATSSSQRKAVGRSGKMGAAAAMAGGAVGGAGTSSGSGANCRGKAVDELLLAGGSVGGVSRETLGAFERLLKDNRKGRDVGRVMDEGVRTGLKELEVHEARQAAAARQWLPSLPKSVGAE